MTISIRPPFTRETALAKVRAAEDAWPASTTSPSPKAIAGSSGRRRVLDRRTNWAFLMSGNQA